jgi:hypothetical protein
VRRRRILERESSRNAAAHGLVRVRARIAPTQRALDPVTSNGRFTPSPVKRAGRDAASAAQPLPSKRAGRLVVLRSQRTTARHFRDAGERTSNPPGNDEKE